MTDKVIVPKIADDLTDHYLAKCGYEVLTVDNPGEEDILSLAPDAAAVMMISKKLSNDIYDQMPNLKILARRGVGYDNIDVNFAAQQGVWVTNTPGDNAHSVAELALMDMLMLGRKFRAVEQQTRAGNWGGAYQLLGNDLVTATVGILGYGQVGRKLAHLLTALGVKVLIYDRHPQSVMDGTLVDWETLFRTSDFVSLHLAAVPSTTHIVGTTEFQWMKPTAGLVNLARGKIVDESALITALQTKSIAGAALDVFEKEPLACKNPLLAMDNVVITPHIGANTVEANRKMAMTAAKMIDAVLSGRTPQCAVNKPVLKKYYSDSEVTPFNG